MKYVLGASVAIKWVLPEVDDAKAIRLLGEAAHSLTKAPRRGLIAKDDTSQMLAEILQSGPVLEPPFPLLFPATASP